MKSHSSRNLLTLALATTLAVTLIAGIASLVGAQDGLLPLPSRIFSEQSKPTSGIGANLDDMGSSVALSADGNVALVGMPGEDTRGSSAGRAIVYVRSGAAWSQQAVLYASDGQATDSFGSSVDLNADGTVAVIGAFGWEFEADPDSDGNGAAYVFRRSGATWTQEQQFIASDGTKFDKFGAAVAISGEGNHILIGATGEDLPTATVLDNGAVYAFTYNGSSWPQTAKIRPFADYNNDAFDRFGSSIAMDYFGNLAVIGAPGADTVSKDEGRAYVFSRAGNDWAKVATLVDVNSQPGDAFGTSVATDNNGTFIVVGAPFADVSGVPDAGAVVTFLRSGGNYLFNQRFTPGDVTNSSHFGQSVTLNGNDGRVAVIGAPGDDDSGSFSGAAYVYLFGTNWTQYAKLMSSDGGAGDNFGASLDISHNRLTVLGGAPNNLNKGAAYVFYDPALVPTVVVPPTNTYTPGGPTITPEPPTITPGGPTLTPQPPTATPTATPPATELLINGGLEQADAEKQPVGWSKKKATKDKVKCNKDLSDPISYEGNCLYQMKNVDGLSGKLLQKVDLASNSVNPGDTLRLEGAIWAKGSSAKAKVKLVVKYADPSIPKAKITVNLEGGQKTWIPFSDLVTNDLIGITGVPSQVKVMLLNKSIGGKLRYDALSVKLFEAGAIFPPTGSDFSTSDLIPLP